MSLLYVDDIRGKTAAASVDLSNATNLKMPAGSIVQTTQTRHTAKSVITSTSFTSVYTCSITPKFATSKILIQVQIGASGTHENAYPVFWQLYKNGSQISGAKGDADGGASAPVACATYTKNYVYYTGTSTSFSFLDSPSTTSSTTYALYGLRHSSAGVCYFNVTGQDINERYARAISTITAMEISG